MKTKTNTVSEEKQSEDWVHGILLNRDGLWIQDLGSDILSVMRKTAKYFLRWSPKEYSVIIWDANGLIESIQGGMG